METKLLETFIAVAETGTLSAAGSLLGVTQSMVSRRLHELELHCKAPLLYRHGRGVRLTPAGELLLREATPLVERVASMLSSVADAGTARSGVVSIGVSPSVMCAVGVRIVETVARDYPGISLQCVTGYSRYVHEWLLQGRIDIGVLSDAGLSNQLVAQDLGHAKVVLVGIPGTVPDVAGPVRLDQLSGIPMILPTKSQGLRRYIDAAAERACIELAIIHEVDDILLTKDLVAAGKGATLVSRLAVLKEVKSGMFRCLDIEAPTLYARSMLATALNRPVTPAIKCVIEVLKSVCGAALDSATSKSKRS